MNNRANVGLDDIGMKAEPVSVEQPRLTRLVEHSGSGVTVVSRGVRSRYERRNRSKKITTLLIFAAAIIIVSAVAVATIGREAPTRAGIRATPPVASFNVTVRPSGYVVAVNAQNSTSAAGIVSYDWNWGDMINQTHMTATHTYETNGNYTITLTVTDAIGQTNSVSHVAHVTGVPIPPTAWIIYGWTFASDGVTPLPGCTITIADLRTGTTLMGTVSDVNGQYYPDISPMFPSTGDTIIVNATGPAGEKGSGTGVLVTDPYLGIDVTLTSGSIPEFTTIAIPVVGMISILAVARVASSRKEEE